MERVSLNTAQSPEIPIVEDAVTVEKTNETNGVTLNANAGKKNEDGLVELSFESETGEEKSAVDILQENYTLELQKYTEYQMELMRLKNKKHQLEMQYEKADDDSESKKTLAARISNLDGLIGNCEKNLQTCSNNMSDLLTDMNKAIRDQVLETYQAIAEQSAALGANVGVPQLTQTGSPVSYNVGNVPYSGEKIPQDFAARLDAKLGQGFSAKLESVSAIIGCNANDLVAMMYSESGLNPKAGNPNGGAIGLIQFMPSTLKGNGYTTEQLANMSALQQLDVVADIMLKAKVMSGYGKNEKIDAGTLYAINFLPAVAKKEVLCTTTDSLSWAYKANSGLDKDGDKAITKSDLAQRLHNKYAEAYRYI